MYLDMRELDQIGVLMDKFRTTGIKPNRFLVNAVLECGIRKGDTDMIYDVL